MKSKILIIIVLCFAKILFAQDSVRIETVVDTAFKTPQYIAAYDDVFLSHKETKWLLKADLIGALGAIFDNDRTLRPSSIELERKIGKTVSVNLGVSSFLELENLVDPIMGDKVQSFTYFIEPRYYLGMNKRIEKGVAANNLNGNYVSLQAGFTKNFLDLSIDGAKGYRPKLPLDKYKFSLNYGMQRRVFNHFYVNYKLGLGVVKTELLTANVDFSTNVITRKSSDETHFGIDNHFTIGLAFGGGKKLNTNNLCDLFRCFEEENQLLKIDIKGLLNRIETGRISSNLSIGYEHKLGKSSFSIDIDWFSKFNLYKFDNSGYSYGILEKGLVSYGYSWFNNPNNNPNPTNSISKYHTTSITIEPRFYYNMKRRIAKGKTANNLSGSYVSVGFTGGYDYDALPKGNYIDIENQLIGNSLSQLWVQTAIKWGHQRRLFKNGFMDFSIAPFWSGFSKITTETGSVFKNSYTSDYFIADFKIGFAF